MKDLAIDLTFYQCRGLTDRDSLKPLVDSLLAAGFEFEQRIGDYMHKINSLEQIEGLIASSLVWAVDSKTNLPIEWDLRFRVRPSNMQDLIGSFEFCQFNARTNRLRIDALIDFEFEDQSDYVELYAQTIKKAALALYAIAKPELGWIEKGDKNTTDETDIRKRRLKVISWVNIFSPEYVHQYGKDFLLGLPGYKTELLPDGGIFHQLTNTFIVPNSKESRAIRQQIVAYCAERGQKVHCYAPYHLPVVAAKATPVAKTMDFNVYLEQILDTTLELDDGTRIKPIYINWADLTSDQQRITIQKIEDVATKELKRAAGRRVRFEFNEIPDELHQMFLSLAGRSEEFEWIRVKMD